MLAHPLFVLGIGILIASDEYADTSGLVVWGAVLGLAGLTFSLIGESYIPKAVKQHNSNYPINISIRVKPNGASLVMKL